MSDLVNDWILPSLGIGIPGVGIPGVDGGDGGSSGVFGSIGDFLFGKKAKAPPLDVQLQLIADAYKKVGPDLFAAVSATEKAQAQSDFDSAKQFGPQYAQLQTELQDKYGPLLAASQAKSTAVSGNAAAELEQQLIKQYGPDTAKAILATVQAADPNGTAAREKIKGLFDTYTQSLSPELNGSERAEINRSLAQQNPYQTGSQLETIRNAQTFGDAGTKKLAAFGEGAARAASLLPAVSSGINPFSVSTLGRDSTNTSASIVDKLTNKGFNDSGTAMGVNNTNQLFGLQNQANAIDASNKDRGFLQAWTRFTQGLGNLGSAVSSFSAACYIAREVFGPTDSRWLQFRAWLLLDASPRLRDWYLANGERVADWLRTRPQTKLKIRKMMEDVIV